MDIKTTDVTVRGVRCYGFVLTLADGTKREFFEVVDGPDEVSRADWCLLLARALHFAQEG